MLRLKKLVILISYLCVGKKNKKKSFEMLHNSRLCDGGEIEAEMFNKPLNLI